MLTKPKVAFIGHPKIGAAIASIRVDWDFVASVETLEDFWQGFNEGHITNDLHAVLAMDTLYGKTKRLISDEDGSGDIEVDSFAFTAAAISPFCLFGVIQYYPNYTDEIRSTVDSLAAQLGYENARVFFIDKNRPAPELRLAVSEFIQHTDNPDLVDIFSGRDPEERRAQERAAAEVAPQEVERNEPVREVDPAPIMDKQSAYGGDNFNSADEDPDENYMGQVVAVTSSKGGSGKSTVAITLATYLAHASEESFRRKVENRPLKIVVLDLDIRDGQVGFLTNNITPTVLHMRSQGISKKTLEETVIHVNNLKIDILLAPKRPRTSNDTPPEFYLELIQTLKRHYDYVILDTSVNYLDPLLEEVAYPIANQIVFVTDIVINSVFSMTRWIMEVTRPVEKQGMGIAPEKIGVVVNKYISNVNMTGEKIQRSINGLNILTAIPNNAKLMAHAANVSSMQTVLRQEGIRKAFTRLAKSVVGKKYELSHDFQVS